MKIHIIRHGTTPLNEAGLYCGQTDVPLSQKGRAEVAEFKEKGIYPQDADIFFTSGYIRTAQTLAIIYGEVEATIIPELAEYDFGDFSMKSHDQLKDLPEYKTWIADETGDIPCPNGESKNQFRERVAAGYARILGEVIKAGSGSAGVVCHAGTISAVMEHLMPDTSNFYNWLPRRGRGYTITYKDGKFTGHTEI